MRAAWILLSAALATGCVNPTYHCTTNAQCVNAGVQGTCGTNGTCTFPTTMVTCPTGEQLTNGSCVAITSTPTCVTPTPDTCSNACTNLKIDPQNCGACGTTCNTVGGEFCNAGACGCGPLTDCNGTCVSTASDPAHCGTCGTICAAGQFCAAGTCTSVCTLTTCGAACVDLMSDPTHCGACDTACPQGRDCVSGACACPANEPNACGTGASALCTNFATDTLHCGGCNTVCAQGSDCVAGHCTCPATTPNACGNGMSALCTNFSTDPNHCGACGTVCNVAGGELCDSGLCGCGTLSDCSGVCKDTLNDPANCGACGRGCGITQYCNAGQCADVGVSVGSGSGSGSCPGNGSAVNNCGPCIDCQLLGYVLPACDATQNPPVCVDQYSDQSDCGSPGQDCGSGSCVQGQCVGSGSGLSCVSGSDSNISISDCGGCNCNQFGYVRPDCDPNGGSPTCVDTYSNPNDCGSPGISCGAGSCYQGGCVGFGSGSGSSCVGSGPGSDVGHCNGCDCTTFGYVQPGCDASQNPPVCVDTYSDQTDCGSLGQDCGSGSCYQGQCVGVMGAGSGSCPAGVVYNCCGSDCTQSGYAIPACDTSNSSCVDLNSDAANCGAVGYSCGGGSCYQGNCTGVGSGSGSNCGADLNTDVNNCGGCGNDCTTRDLITPACANGACVDLANNPHNCGAVGIVCTGDRYCDQGACVH